MTSYVKQGRRVTINSVTNTGKAGTDPSSTFTKNHLDNTAYHDSHDNH